MPQSRILDNMGCWAVDPIIMADLKDRIIRAAKLDGSLHKGVQD
jgi:hypothetical protein